MSTILGIHMFHTMLHPDDTRENEVIISMSDGVGWSYQYGPVLDQEAKYYLANILNSRNLKIADRDSIVWYMLDLARHIPDFRIRHVAMEGLDNEAEFNVFSYYQDTPQNRSRSMDLACYNATRTQLLPNGDPIGYHSLRDREILGFTCPQHVANEYRGALPFFRMKWLEIQGLEIDVYDHRLELIPTKTKKEGEDDELVTSTKFKLTLSAWPTHMVMGSRLEVDIKDLDGPAVPVNLKIKDNVIVFEMDILDMTVDDITGLRVCRSEETLSNVISTLRAGAFLLTGSEDDRNNPFIRKMFRLPPRIRPTPSDSDIASLYKEEKPKDMGVHEWREVQEEMKEAMAADHVLLTQELDEKEFIKVNDKQRECAESNSTILMCVGYPGTGKTKTLAAYALSRFRYLTTLESGWVICLTNSNVAARAVLGKLLAYPPLHGYIKHAYSSLFKAFHPEDFQESLKFRITPKEELSAHGIMVCTTGKLRVVLRKHPLLAKRAFDLITDESGQIWKLSSIDFLTKLPNLQRWGIFGDTAQLPPYVTRLIDLDEVQPSVMDVFLEPTRVTVDALVVRLNVQYRMIPVICEAHAPVFYDYPITSVRTVLNNPAHDGRFYRYVTASGRGFRERSCNMALDTFEAIHAMNLTDETGNTYNFIIITPYVLVMEKLLLMAKSRNISRQDVKIRTYDRVQGDEANVVIIVTGNSTCSDLNKDTARANVALSRARDIIVVIASERFFKLRGRGGNRIVHWGRWLLRPFLRYFDHPHTDRPSRNAVGQVQTLSDAIVHRDCNSSGSLVSRGPRRGPSDSRASGPHGLEERQRVGKRILLKGRYGANRWRNKVLFRAFCECEDEAVVEDIIACWSTDLHIHQKYARTFGLLGLDQQDQTVDRATETLVRAQYTQRYSSSRAARAHQNRGSAGHELGDHQATGKQILLKQKYWLNGWRNKVLFRAFCECRDEDVINSVVDCWSTTSLHANDKYARTFVLFGIDERDAASQTVDEETEALVRAQYTVHVRPSRSKRRQRGRGGR